MAIPGFPNYFTLCGINGVVAYAPLFLSAELQTDYITRWVKRLRDETLATVEVCSDATRRYNDQIQSELRTMSWAGDCPSFYRDASGRVLSFHPGTLGHYRRELRHIIDDHFRTEPAVQPSLR